MINHGVKEDLKICTDRARHCRIPNEYIILNEPIQEILLYSLLKFVYMRF